MKNIFIPTNIPSPASNSSILPFKSKKEKKEEEKSINLLRNLLFRSSISRLRLVTDDFRPLRLNKTRIGMKVAEVEMEGHKNAKDSRYEWRSVLNEVLIPVLLRCLLQPVWNRRRHSSSNPATN